MFRQAIAATGIVLACSNALAQDPESPGTCFVRGYGVHPTPPPITFPAAPLVGGSDNCATADVITGGGPFAFDFTNATTGTEGQITFVGGDCNVGCAEYGNGEAAILQDVWFSWTAPTTGRIDVSTCGTTVDTKLAVYDGTSGCPTGVHCLGCSDDYNYGYSLSFGSRVITQVTAGQNIKIQLGASSLGVSGTIGTFTIDYATFDEIKDDGSSENAYHWGGPGSAMFAIEPFGSPGATTTVTGVSVAWGCPLAQLATNGTPARIAVWKDGNNDGNPNDAVLLQSQPTTVQSANTDTYVTINLSPPVTVTGVYFIGLIENQISANDYPFAYDGSGCASQPNTAWFGFNSSGVADLVNLPNNTQAPRALNIVCQMHDPSTYNGEFHGTWLLRPVIQSGPTPLGTSFCIGDGVGSHTTCPCGNNSATIDEVGCTNSLNIGGKLRGTGVASLGGDTAILEGSQMPNSTCLYFQGTLQLAGGNGATFGDGLRCAGGSVIRLGQATNVAGGSTYPSGTQPTISVKGAVTSAGTRTYQGWYRNAAAFCTPSTFNLTNGLEVAWMP